MLKVLHQAHNLQTHSPLNTRRTAGRSVENSPLMRCMGTLVLCSFHYQISETVIKTHTQIRTHAHKHTHAHKRTHVRAHAHTNTRAHPHTRTHARISMF